mmetsp:Transcript_41716/g.65132  ORF Transcript_41716/g.65132 Transcript_41716/m.65132 type:complete len:83 (-) Transcript_41716:57-305(-)
MLPFIRLVAPFPGGADLLEDLEPEGLLGADPGDVGLIVRESGLVAEGLGLSADDLGLRADCCEVNAGGRSAQTITIVSSNTS